MERELARVHLGGSLPGNAGWAPEDLVPETGLVRDGGLGTIGGGNHFVEVQVVEEIQDRALAWEWGVKAGSIAFMIHSGSRNVGKHIGGYWKDRAVEAWPRGVRHPPSRIFPLSWKADPDLANAYLEAEATAANYGFVNRMILAEMLRQRLRALVGEVEAPLIYDLPHNISLKEGDRWVARKGACPAHAGQPVIIPGSMGTASYLLVGEGREQWLSSASHGAGRAVSRFEMGRIPKEKLGLAGVDCITLKEERRMEEAPAAYKPITSVIDAQVRQGTVRPVARLRPVLTFKA
jgi:tRNA-splicing ligase RtcB